MPWQRLVIRKNCTNFCEKFSARNRQISICQKYQAITENNESLADIYSNCRREVEYNNTIYQKLIEHGNAESLNYATNTKASELIKKHTNTLKENQKSVNRSYTQPPKPTKSKHARMPKDNYECASY